MPPAERVLRWQPTGQGTRLAAEWHRGVGSLVRLCVGIRNGFRAFEKDKALLDAFLAPLVEGGVITADEAMLVQLGP